MTTTSILSGTRLARDISHGLAALLGKAEAAAPLAGAGAHAFTRHTIYVQTQPEVDAIAAEWGVTPKWDLDCGLYTAKSGNAASEMVVMFTSPEARATA